MADEPLQRGDAGVALLYKIDGLGIVVIGAGLMFLDPDPMSWRQMSCFLPKACSVEPERYSSTTWRLKEVLWRRCCLRIGFHTPKAQARKITRPMCPTLGEHST